MKKKTIQERGHEFAKRASPSYGFFELQIKEDGADPIVIIRDYMAMAYVNAWYNGRAALRKDLRRAKR